MSLTKKITIKQLGQQAKTASKELNSLSSEKKNQILLDMAKDLRANNDLVLRENAKDMQNAKEAGVAGALLDRLLLSKDRVEEMAAALEDIASLDDPIGNIDSTWELSNGLKIKKVKVPLGVIGIIYEARPNVTVEAAGLSLKSGNAVILRGGSLAINSNKVLVAVLQESILNAGLSRNAVQVLEDTSHETADEFMALKDLDVLIPRGGNALIKAVVEKAKVPVLWAAAGNCHTYIDKDADLDKAIPIILNAKVQRPGVCNAMETLLVHTDIASKFLPKAIKELQDKGVEVRVDDKVKHIITSYFCHPEQSEGSRDSSSQAPRNDTIRIDPGLVKEATEKDYYTEFLDLILAVKVVDSLDDAIEHINKYGTRHSEAIITENKISAKKFTIEVDAAAVYTNASTRFTDGSQFGMGAEIGISTQKLHVRGPMGLEALTSTKYIIEGEGQVRG